LLAVPAGYALARMTGAWAQTLSDDIPHLSGAADDSIHPVLAHHRAVGIAGIGVVAHPRLSSFTVPFCIASDVFLGDSS
jgi:hypothetical protein